MKVILGGGGSAEDERPLNELLSWWIGAQGRLLYWPIAMRGLRSFESCHDWIASSLSTFGITDITMWTELAGHHESELDAFEGVYIGGGNTFSLLAELRETNFDRYLQDYVQGGSPVYGGSAGAAILGRDIRTVEHIDFNLVGLTDTAGLNMVNGHGIWPHYKPQHDRLIRAYIELYKFPVLAISERSGIVIEGNELHSAGFEPALHFDEQGRSEF